MASKEETYFLFKRKKLLWSSISSIDLGIVKDVPPTFESLQKGYPLFTHKRLPQLRAVIGSSPDFDHKSGLVFFDCG